MNRPLLGVLGAALAVTLSAAAPAAAAPAAATPAAAAPSTGSTGTPVDPATTLLQGQLVRVERPHLQSPDDVLAAHHETSTGPAADQHTEGDDDSVASSDAMLVVGEVAVPLDPTTVATVPTGTHLTVEVPVPARVQRAVAAGRALPTSVTGVRTALVKVQTLDAAEDAPAAARSTLATVSAVDAATSGTPVTAHVLATAPAATIASSAEHQVSVAVVDYRGMVSTSTDAEVRALVTSASDYWSEQTGGAVTFAVKGAIARYASAGTCANLAGLWSEAATRTGFTPGADAHLLVVLPGGAYAKGCPLGVGSVSGGIDGGGYVAVTSTGTSALAHEIGHNLSLMHANRLFCSAGDALKTSGCGQEEYGDMPDVMGYATNLPNIGNLSAAALARLGLLGDDQVAVTSTGEASVTLQPLSTHSGVRSAVVTDPRSTNRYYLENRQDTGRDRAGWGVFATMTYGLRVLRVSPDGHTLLLDPTPHSKSVRDTDAVIAPGTTFRSAGDGVEVRAVQNPDGSVTAKLSVAAVGGQHWSSTLTATTIVAADATSTIGATASLPLTVTAADSSLVNGVVTASEGGKKLATATIRGGAGTLRISRQPLGSHTLTLAFAPTTSVKSPTPFRYASASLGLTVTTIPSTTAVTAPVTTTVADQAKLVVKVKAKGTTPTGTVTVSEGDTVLGTSALKAGSATLLLPVLALGDHPLALAYSGDAKTAASSLTKVLTVSPKPVSVLTAATVSTTTAKSARVLVSAKVAGRASTGTVTLTEGDTSYGTASLVNGTATFTLPPLSAGTHALTATHAGPAAITGGTGTVQVVVAQA